MPSKPTEVRIANAIQSTKRGTKDNAYVLASTVSNLQNPKDNDQQRNTIKWPRSRTSYGPGRPHGSGDHASKPKLSDQGRWILPPIVPVSRGSVDGRSWSTPTATEGTNDATITSVGGPETEVASQRTTSSSSWLTEPTSHKRAGGVEKFLLEVAHSPSARVETVGEDGTASTKFGRRARPSAPKPKPHRRHSASSDVSAFVATERLPSVDRFDLDAMAISTSVNKGWKEAWTAPPPSQQSFERTDTLKSMSSSLLRIGLVKTEESKDPQANKSVAMKRGVTSFTEEKLLTSSFPESTGKVKEEDIYPATQMTSPKDKTKMSTSTKESFKGEIRISDSTSPWSLIGNKMQRRTSESSERKTEKGEGRLSFPTIMEMSESTGSTAQPVAPEILPTPSVGFVPSTSPRTQTGELSSRYCPWHPRSIFDAWVPQRPVFPAWLSTGEEEKICKDIAAEKQIPCQPRRTNFETTPSCCEILEKKVKLTETKMGGRIRGQKMPRPEVRRWILGYPQHTRFNREAQDLTRYPPPGTAVTRDEENPRHMLAQLEGPQNSLYEGGLFRIEIFFPEMYPKEPPKLRFMTKIFHPNIDRLGRIRMPVVEEKWTQSVLLRQVFDSLRELLSNPNLSDPLAIDVARRWHWHEDDAKQTARAWTKKYAHGHSAAGWLDCHCECTCEQYATMTPLI